MPPPIVIVPCFNEERRLATAEFAAFARTSATQLLFVDDGSADGTRSVLAEIVESSGGRAATLALPRNRGKGEAVRAGLNAAIERGAELVAYLDADLSTPLPEMERLLALATELSADAVLGARVALLGHQIDRSPARHYLGRVFGTLASLVLRQQVYDTQCGAKVFKVTPALQQALVTPFRARWAFDVELLSRLLAADPDVRLVEVPLTEWVDIGGSKLTPGGMARAAWELLSLSRTVR